MTGWMRLELFRMPSGMGFLPFTSKHLKCGHKIRPNQVSSRDFGTSGEGEVWYPDIFRSEKRQFRALASKNYSIGGNHPRAKRNRVSTISLVQVDEKFTKFQFFKQLCPSWDLPCDSVHEPNDFSCSCSGLERNPLEKKNTGIAFSTAASPSVWWWKLPAETLRFWRWMALKFIHGWVFQSVIVLLSSRVRNIGNPLLRTKVYKSLLTNGDGIILEVNLSSKSYMGWMCHIIMTIICSSEGFQTIWSW